MSVCPSGRIEIVCRLPRVVSDRFAAKFCHPANVRVRRDPMTGFMGGAICTHFRVGEIATVSQLVSLLLGGGAWGALYLRDLRSELCYLL
jgi:hypothetical protein